MFAKIGHTNTNTNVTIATDCTEQELVDRAVPDGSFPLPALALKRPGAVLNEAVAVIRNERARRHGQPGRVFTSDEMVTGSRHRLCKSAFEPRVSCSLASPDVGALSTRPQ